MATTGVGLVSYHINHNDQLDAFNDGWRTFALANDGAVLDPSRIHGRVLWDFVSDETTRHLYQLMCLRLRDGGRPIRFRFRCDAPERRRLLMMDMQSDGTGGIQFSVSSVLEAQRPPMRLLDATEQRSDALIGMCAWCKKVRTDPDTWCEVEDAVEALRLFEGTELPRVSHGMCEPCETAMMQGLDDPASTLVTVGAFVAS